MADNDQNLQPERYGGANGGLLKPKKGVAILCAITVTLSMFVALLTTNLDTVKSWFTPSTEAGDIIEDPNIENPDIPGVDQGGEQTPGTDQGGTETPGTDQGGDQNQDQQEVTQEQKLTAIAENLFASKFGTQGRTVEVLNCYLNNDCTATFGGNDVAATKVTVNAKITNNGKVTYKSSAIIIDGTGYATIEEAIDAIYGKTVDDQGKVDLAAGGCKTKSVAQAGDLNNYLTLTCNLSSEEAKNRMDTMNENIKSFFNLSADHTVIVTDGYRDQRDAKGNGVYCLNIEVYDANGVLVGYKVIEIDQPYNFLNKEIFEELLGSATSPNAICTYDGEVYKGYTANANGEKVVTEPGMSLS